MKPTKWMDMSKDKRAEVMENIRRKAEENPDDVFADAAWEMMKWIDRTATVH